MIRKTHLVLAMGAVGLLGLAVIAMGQLAGPAAQQEYEQRLKALNHNNADDVYVLAKWCYQNNLAEESRTLALEAGVKAPDDVRPKYLLYALAAGPVTGAEVVEGGGSETQIAATISDVEVDEIYKKEGVTAMNGFRTIQQMLTQRCGTPKCHGSNDARWILIRKDQASRKTLAENFRTVNQYISRGDQSPDSRLLQVPVKGLDKHSVQLRGTTDAVYIAMAKWIKSLKTTTVWDK